MKRFFETVAVTDAPGGWQVTLDGRPLRTQASKLEQVVPTRALADAMAAEWEGQGEEIDPRSLILRDLADYAIDQVAPARATVIGAILPYGETDTLCYRAEPDEPLHARQEKMWEPLVQAAETRHAIRLERVSGVIHRPQPRETMDRLQSVLEGEDEFALAALQTLASIAASLTIALAAREPDADADALFAAANCEEDWQAELWGTDSEAEAARAARLEAFRRAVRFLQLARQR